MLVSLYDNIHLLPLQKKTYQKNTQLQENDTEGFLGWDYIVSLNEGSHETQHTIRKHVDDFTYCVSGYLDILHQQ